jgi:hypothetical protein
MPYVLLLYILNQFNFDKWGKVQGFNAFWDLHDALGLGEVYGPSIKGREDGGN